MRRTLTTLHRWFGLFTAVFLVISGTTGAIIAWDHELDALLNPELYRSQPSAAGKIPTLELADRLERADPRAAVRFMPLATEPGETLLFFMRPRLDPATHQPYALDFNQVAVDPHTGAIQAKRVWGEVSLARANLLPFIYRLHYTLHLPEWRGTDWGMLTMGIVAIVWVIDGLIAILISFPSRKVWRRSFAFRWRRGGHRFVFDLHRSGGVWIWICLLTVAITSVSMNLGDSVMRPIVALFSPLSPEPFAAARGEGERGLSEADISRADLLEIASAEAARRGWTAPAGGIFYDPAAGLYGVGFYEPGKDHGDGGLGNPWLYFRGSDGSLAGGEVPGEGTAGDLFMQAQFPIHSGRILGLAGRICVTAFGIGVATLSATGIVIWARRRRRRSSDPQPSQRALFLVE